MAAKIGHFKCPVCGAAFKGKLSSDYYCGGDQTGKTHPMAAIVFVMPFPVRKIELPGPYWRQK